MRHLAASHTRLETASTGFVPASWRANNSRCLPALGKHGTKDRQAAADKGHTSWQATRRGMPPPAGGVGRVAAQGRNKNFMHGVGGFQRFCPAGFDKQTPTSGATLSLIPSPVGRQSPIAPPPPFKSVTLHPNAVATLRPEGQQQLKPPKTPLSRRAAGTTKWSGPGVRAPSISPLQLFGRGAGGEGTRRYNSGRQQTSPNQLVRQPPLTRPLARPPSPAVRERGGVSTWGMKLCSTAGQASSGTRHAGLVGSADKTAGSRKAARLW